MIKTLFFDFDGVLTTDSNGTTTICGHLCKAAPGISLETMTGCYRKHCKRLTLGGNFAEAWDAFCGCIGQNIAPEIRQHALRTVPKNEAMFALIASLHGKYKLGIITDNEDERIELIRKDLKLDDLFDPIIVSASVHALKHDGTRTIFDAALKAADCKPGESFFIDNHEWNLVTAKEMGMHTYWHDDAKNDIPLLRKTLAELGVRES
jgi:FMN phosphatase YigB (HAD superfamily)